MNKQVWGALGIVLGAWLVLAIASFFFLARPNENRFDFYPRWAGARAILRGASPYTDAVTQQVQLDMFGQILTPEQDQHRFAYVPWIAWLLLPFWLVAFPFAISAWSALQLLILIGAPLIVASILDWRIKPFELVIVACASLLVYRYPINSYILGQFIPFLLLCLVAAWWGMARGKQWLTCCALIFLLVRPEVIFVPLGALLALAWQNGMRRVGLIWGGVGFALWLWTRVWIGAWEVDFYRGILAYQKYSASRWLPSLLENPALEILLVALTMAWCAWMLWQVRALALNERVGWILAATILAELILVPQTANYTLILALIPLWLVFWVFRERYLVWLLLVSVMGLPWLFSFGILYPMYWEQLVIPFALAVLLTTSFLARKNFASHPLQVQA